MSYDLQLWSIDAPSRLHLKPDIEWTEAPKAWIHSRRTWQIVVSHADRVEAEDIPAEVAAQFPGIGFLTQLNLEGQANTSSIRLIQSVARSMARQTHGAVVDPQLDAIVGARGAVRLKGTRKEERFTAIALSWWFLDGPLVTEPGRGELLDLLTTELPEALPRRYGTYEPPEFRYEIDGRAHFEDLLSRNLYLIVVWSPRRPVARVHFHCPKTVGGTPKGFRTNIFQLHLEHEALRQPGWHTQLRRFWAAMSTLIQPFYGDVRLLRQQPRSYYSGENDPSETHPVRFCWWRGVPKQHGCAMVLGAEYQRLWPRAVQSAEKKQGLAFVSTPDWCSDQTIADQTGEVPETIASRPFVWPPTYSTMNAPINTRDSYPEQWPFEDPFGGGERC